MFLLENQAILGRIQARLAHWRAHRPNAQLLAALGDEFGALQGGAAAAGFNDVAELGRRAHDLLAGSGGNLFAADAADDVGLLNLLEEIHAGLCMDFGFVPAATRAHVEALNRMLESLLSKAIDGDNENNGDLEDNRNGAARGLFGETTTRIPTLAPAPPSAWRVEKNGQESNRASNSSGRLNVDASAFGDHLLWLRHIAETAAEGGGKRVELSLAGGAIEADRRVVEGMLGVFRRLIDNSIQHGMEDAEQRAALGKRAVGRIDIALARRGDELLIEYTDDGAGWRRQTPSASELDAGMASDAHAVNDERVAEIAAARWLQIIIRGGGLAAARQAVRELGGSMAVDFSAGQGARFQFQLPLTGAPPPPALLLTAGGRRFAVSARAVERLMRARADDITEIDGQQSIAVGDAGGEQRMPLINLAEATGQTASGEPLENGARRARPTWLASIRLVDRIAAFAADEFLGVVNLTATKPDTELNAIRGVESAAVLADSSVAAVLDPHAFINLDAAPPQPVALLRFPLFDLDAMPSRAAAEAESHSDAAAPWSARPHALALETEAGRLLIPLNLVAEVVGAVEPKPSRREDQSQRDFILGEFDWRGCAVPLLNAAAAFGVAAATSQRHDCAAILWPMKGGKPHEFFAIAGAAHAEILDIDATPLGAEFEPVEPLNNILGYLQASGRASAIPDLENLARGIFPEQPMALHA